MATIRTAILVIVLLAGFTAAMLAWFVARRIVRELDKNHQAIVAIGAGEPLRGEDELTIREARDLAGAVRLMEASSKAAAERSRRVTARKDRERTVGSALAASRDAQFAPAVRTLAGAGVAARFCGDPPPGSFFALGAAGARGAVVLGRCSGASPQEAFARAVAARRFIEERLPAMPAADCVKAARAAHAIDDVRFAEWTESDAAPEGTVLVALADARTVEPAARYAEHNRDAPPAELLDGIELLLKPDGVFAAVRQR
jgi:hypothetical protein